VGQQMRIRKEANITKKIQNNMKFYIPFYINSEMVFNGILTLNDIHSECHIGLKRKSSPFVAYKNCISVTKTNIGLV
jgi:hypothetical protein